MFTVTLEIMDLGGDTPQEAAETFFHVIMRDRVTLYVDVSDGEGTTYGIEIDADKMKSIYQLARDDEKGES